MFLRRKQTNQITIEDIKEEMNNLENRLNELYVPGLSQKVQIKNLDKKLEESFDYLKELLQAKEETCKSDEVRGNFLNTAKKFIHYAEQTFHVYKISKKEDAPLVFDCCSLYHLIFLNGVIDNLEPLVKNNPDHRKKLVEIKRMLEAYYVKNSLVLPKSLLEKAGENSVFESYMALLNVDVSLKSKKIKKLEKEVIKEINGLMSKMVDYLVGKFSKNELNVPDVVSCIDFSWNHYKEEHLRIPKHLRYFRKVVMKGN